MPRGREGVVARGTGIDADAAIPSSGTREAKMPENFRLTLRPIEPMMPRDSAFSSVGETGGDGSSGMVETVLESFSAGRKIAPSLGPQSGPKNRDRKEPMT